MGANDTLCAQNLKRFNSYADINRKSHNHINDWGERDFKLQSFFSLIHHDSEEEPLTPKHLLLLKGNLIYRLAHSTQIAITRAGVGFECSTVSSQSFLATLGQRISSQSFAAAKMVQCREKFRCRGCSIVG